jgi:hypothetical protein
MVTRRALLRAGGAAGLAGLAGCLAPANTVPATDGGNDTDGGNVTRPTDRDRPLDATARLSVTAEDPAPDLPVRPRLSVADPFATGGSPPVIRVDVENTTDRPVVVGEYRDVVFQYIHAADGPLVWLPHSERSTAGEPDRATPDLPTAGDGCWRLDSDIAVTQEYGTEEIPPGGTLTAFVGLYATQDAEDCLPTGDHRFEAEYAYFPDGVGGDGRRDAEWGFSVAVEALEPGE